MVQSVASAEMIAGLAAHPADNGHDADRFGNTPFVSGRVVATLARLFEGLAVIITGWISAMIYPSLAHLAEKQPFLPIILAMGIAFPLIMQLAGGYRLRKLLDPISNAATTAALWTLAFVASAVPLFLFKGSEDYSSTWIAIWFLIGAMALVSYRFSVSVLVRRWNEEGQLNRRAVIVGGGKAARELAAALNSSTASGVTIVGVFDDRSDSRVVLDDGNLRRLGNISQLIDFVRRTRVDMLLVTLPVTAEARLLDVLRRLWVLPVDIRLSAQNQPLRYRPRAYSYIGGVPFLDVFDKPLGEWGPLVKAIEDKTLAVPMLILLSPVMLFAAIAVKLTSRGPILSKLKCFGFNNELIEVYRFRTTRHAMPTADGEGLDSESDPGITPVGRLLRWLHIDGLPQLFNVLNGSLSLVGPRPHATRAAAADTLHFNVVDGYFARHRVKPGITGRAQVKGWRDEADTPEKIYRHLEDDLYYIENWSLWLDLRILAKTPIAAIRGENAY
jgi:Undecaprenyl-phosphate glucose phosphotransferase